MYLEDKNYKTAELFATWLEKTRAENRIKQISKDLEQICHTCKERKVSSMYT